MFTLNAFGQRVYCTPRLRFAKEPEGGGGGGGEKKPEPKPKDDKSDERGFPANTPVAEMSGDEREAYYKFHARKHEDRVKAYGDVTPEKLAEMQKELDELRDKGKTADEKALDDAREAGRSEVRSELTQLQANVALEKALAGRTPDVTALLELDRSTFVKDGKVDADAIKVWVEEHSTEGTTTGSGKRPAPDLGQGRRRGENAPEKGVSAGRDLFDQGRKKPATTPTS